MSWRGESIRHRLSALGVKSVSRGIKDIRGIDEHKMPPKELYNNSTFNTSSLWDMENVIRLFWWCSVNDAWGWFEFDEVFKYMKSYIEDEYFKGEFVSSYFDELNHKKYDLIEYKGLDNDEAEKIAYSGVAERKIYYEDKWLEDEDVRNLVKGLVLHDSYKSGLWNIWKDLNDYRKHYTLSKSRHLFETVIHFEHTHGYMFDIDIEDLREEFEEEYT